MTIEHRPGRQIEIAILVVSGLLLSALLLSDSFRQLAKLFAERKPGLWGEPAWYIFLMYAYGVLVLVFFVNVALIVFKPVHKVTYKRHAAFLVGLTLIRGLFYSAITPPWQSPDEHAHFEYAALLGQLKRVPTLDDLSPDLQRRIAVSMFDHDFWRLIKREPPESAPIGLLPQDGITYYPPTHIVDNRFLYHPQVGQDPPLYYIAPAIPYLGFPQLDPALQLYVMRLTTVLMFVLLIMVVIWIAQRLFYDDMLMIIGVPTLIAFHPMLTYMGGVLNNDVLAAVFTTLLLGVLGIIVQTGLNWQRRLILVGLVLLGLLTKHSTVWTIPLIIGVGLIYESHNVWVRYVTYLIIAGILALTTSLFIPSRQVRYWTSPSSPWKSTAVHIPSPDGAWALRVAGGAFEKGMLEQNLLSQHVIDLRGCEVHLVAQVRTVSGEHRGELVLKDLDHGASFETEFTAGSEWRDVVLRFVIPDDAMNLQVALTSAPGSVIYFDQVAIVDSSAPNAKTEWLRNGSGEQIRTVGEIVLVELSQRIGLSGVVQRFFGSWQDNFKKLLSDPRPIKLGVRSFWGNFGAALLIPLPAWTFKILNYTFGIGLVGLGIYFFKAQIHKEKRVKIEQRWYFLILGAALLWALFETLMPVLSMYGIWTPQGRYLFPVIFPIGVFMMLGWAQLIPCHKHKWLLVAMTLGTIMLDFTSLKLLANYFYGI